MPGETETEPLSLTKAGTQSPQQGEVCHPLQNPEALPSTWLKVDQNPQSCEVQPITMASEVYSFQHRTKEEGKEYL